MGNEVNVFFNSKQNILAVFLGNCRQSDVFARNIYALVCTEHSVVLHLCYKHRTYIFDNKHIKLAIIKKYMVAFLNIFSEVWIRHVYDVV